MEKRERLQALDGLRAVFGMGIVIYHAGSAFGAPFSGALGPVYQYGGYFGNYFFFLLSGFLANYQKVETGEGPFWGSLRKRLRRVYPVYTLSNLAMMVFETGALSLGRTCATFLMVSTGGVFPMPYNFPGWFLCVLLLCGLVHEALRRLPDRRLCLALCALLALGGAVLEGLDGSVPLLSRVCGEGYLNYFLGVLLAEWLRRPGGPGRRFFWVVPGGLGALGVLLGAEGLPGDFRWWITAFCAGLIPAVLGNRRLERWLSLPGLTDLGRCGLSLLLWHIPLCRLWVRTAGRVLVPSVSFGLYLTAVVVAALLSRRYLEEGLRRLGRA